MGCIRGGGVATITLGIFLIGVCGRLVVPFEPLSGLLATGVLLSFTLSSRSFSLLELPVSLDIIRWKRPVDLKDDVAGDWGGREGAKSSGGPRSKKSIKSRALLEILVGFGVLKLDNARCSDFSSSEPFMMSSRSMSVILRERLGLSESSRGPGP